MNRRRRLLITGASGFLGWNICRIAAPDNEVIGICNRRFVAIRGVAMERCDCTDYRELKSTFKRLNPEAVIHAAAAANPNYCQEHPADARRINVSASESVAGLCEDSGIPCAFISSDQVFDGTAAPYNEECQPCPVNIYGEQKLEAERAMRSRHDRLVVCRMPLMYGDAPQGAHSFIQPLIRDLEEGKIPALFTDEFRTPVGGFPAARGILRMLEKGPGVIHLGGRERISRYGFGLLLAEVLGKPSAKIRAVCRKDVPMPASRPKDVALDSSKAFALGFAPPELREDLLTLQCIMAR